MITRDEAIRMAAAISGAPYEQIEKQLNAWLYKFIKPIDLQALNGLSYPKSRRRHIVNALNRTKEPK